MTKAEFSRLPSSVIPSNYKIHLIPDLANFTFKGECEVKVAVKEETDLVICNASNLEVHAAFVLVEGQEEITAETSSSAEEEKLTLKLGKKLSVGPAVIKYRFSGILNDQMRGFYRSKYTKDGEDRYAAVTQFESTDARQAFPCWDEPALKATFDLTVTGPKDRIILSNMPEKNVTEDGDNKTVSFDSTPIMSTYLVAIIVGEFEYVEGCTPDGINVKVYSPLGKKDQGQFALECGVKALSFYKEFFNVPYPLKKYDMVAIPDFSAGAMENWGLVTYRETCILVDKENTSAATKEYVAIVVCHETAHQWFGNLVTMEWWTHLWLNEGFASFMENLTTDALYPEYKIWDQFIPSTLIKALNLDALASSHAIEVPVGHPSEVDEIFDNISYNKGASVIRMLFNWIGEANFKTGMHNYLTKYSYQNAETPQLWAELEATSGLPVTKVMTTWTKQMGFPVISVKSRQDGPDRILTLSQSKFVSGGNMDVSSYFWQIPVSILQGGSNHVTKILMDQQTMTITIPNVKPDEWIKLNPGFVGFYRVLYSPEDMELLCSAVRSRKLSQIDRLNVLDDLFSLIMAGKASSVDGLRLLQAYKNEDHFVVWNSINDAVSNLSTLLADQDYYCNFQRFVLDLFSEVKAKVIWDEVEGEDHLDTLLRSLVLARLGKFGDEDVRAEAKRRFGLISNGSAKIKADIRSVVYACTAAGGDDTDFENMVKLFKNSDMSEEKDRLTISGMASFGSKELLTKALHFAISENVRSQDTCHFIGRIAKNKNGRDLAWEFFKENFDMFRSRYKSGFLISHLVKSVSEGFVNEEKAAMIQKYFEENPLPGSERNVSQAVETIRLNSAWLFRDGASIKKFFETI
jgi:puromycin-sensitive aminopeptidase